MTTDAEQYAKNAKSPSSGLRVLVCGGRDFRNRHLAFRELDRLHRERAISLIIEGGQRTFDRGRPVGGADWFAQEWASERSVDVLTVAALWSDLSHHDRVVKRTRTGKLYDARAGFRRNEAMLGEAPDIIVAFAGGNGTADMVRRAKAAGIEVREIGHAESR